LKHTLKSNSVVISFSVLKS